MHTHRRMSGTLLQRLTGRDDRTVTSLIYYRPFIAGEQASRDIAESAATADAAARAGLRRLTNPANTRPPAWKTGGR